MALTDTLRIETVSADKRHVEATMPIVPEVFQPHGYLHGGAMEALIDNAAGAVCLTIGAHVVTLHSDVSYIKGVPLKTMPRIFAEARIMKATHHMIFVDVVVRSGKEELLARGNMVMFRNGTDTRIPEKW